MDRDNSTASGCLSVQVTSSTWARDSHDLFDFEAHHLHTKTFVVQKSMKCVRSGTDVLMQAEQQTAIQGHDPLLRLVQKEGTFWVDKATPSSSCKKLWLVVRDMATCGHRLVEGDIIKLGRFKFRVRQMVASSCGGAQPELRLDDNGGSTCDVDGNHIEEHAQTLCRICLLEGSSDDDPLVSPCQCKGSIEYVHLGCLRHWIRGRLNLSDNAGGSYFFRPLACELCKAVYPTYVGLPQSERAPLVEVPRTQPPFIVLENMVRDSQQHASRGLHVISLAEKVLKLGRGHESDVRIADVSISRYHATIRFHRGTFLLEDNNSKFGTLVALKKPRPLEANSPISIQMGRTVLQLTMQPNAEGGGPAGATPSLQQLPGSSAEDERALRLSLLTRAPTGGSTSSGPREDELGGGAIGRVGSSAAESEQGHQATL
jgi:hypothetical protein